MNDITKLNNVREYFNTRINVWSTRLAQVGVLDAATKVMILDRLDKLKEDLKEVELDIIHATGGN